MYYWINAFLFTFFTFLIVMIFPLCLTKRYPKWSNARYAFYIVLIIFIPSCLKFIYAENGLFNGILYYFLQIFIILLLAIGFTEKIWVKILFYVLQIIIMSFAESIIFSVFENITGISIDISWKTRESTIFLLFDMMVTFFFLIIYAFVWNKIARKHFISSKVMLVFGFMPISQFFFTEMSTRCLHISNNVAVILSIVTFLLGFLTSMLFLFILTDQEQKRELQADLHRMQLLWQKEKNNYVQIASEVEDMGKLRHDYQNQLMTILSMVEHGEPVEGYMASLEEAYRQSGF